MDLSTIILSAGAPGNLVRRNRWGPIAHGLKAAERLEVYKAVTLSKHTSTLVCGCLHATAIIGEEMVVQQHNILQHYKKKNHHILIFFLILLLLISVVDYLVSKT